jgi:heat shock protein HtpX
MFSRRKEMKRVFLFLATNLAVMVVLSIVASVLGVNRFLTANGLDMGALLGFAAVFGFGGALISLAISKWSAKMATGARIIDAPQNAEERWLVETVQRHAQAVGIGMPEVAIFPAREVNAFATGMSRNNALVAVSSGLLQQMTRAEAEAVIGHEVAHVANGDMVTLALIQGVLNTFAVGSFIDRVVFKNEDGPGVGYFAIHIVLEIALGILASMIVMWFSRRREFRADVGGARLAGRENMIAALRRLQMVYEESAMPAKLTAFAISGSGRQGLARFFASHPSLEDRIAALQSSREF